eukprot:comp17008_c0_seq1/m.15684 comp17008_c0_seq1/g.15684  ORF comp17008_c0_seq1/g.15684 comp17008_c0_seq1/m.15684 type:complete len:384 (-) comp17008_c0_seq1:631-1782(-)
MAGMDLDLEVAYEAAWVETAPMDVEECTVEVTMLENGDVSIVAETSEGFSCDDDLVSVSVEYELESTEDAEGEFTPILQRGGKKHLRRQKSVTFRDEVEIFYIENANTGRKVSEICSPKKAPAPSANKKIYRCETANGPLFIEMDDIAVEYLSYIQHERNCGRQVVVTDFFKEARQYAEACKQAEEASMTAMCDDDSSDMDLYSASKQRYRPPRHSRKFQQQQQKNNGGVRTKNPHQQYENQHGAGSEEDCNSDPDIPSASVAKEEGSPSGSPRTSHRQGRRTSAPHRQTQCHNGDHQSQWACGQQDTLVYKQRQRFSQIVPPAFKNAAPQNTPSVQPSQVYGAGAQYSQGWQRKQSIPPSNAKQTPPRGGRQQQQRFSRSLK